MTTTTRGYNGTITFDGALVTIERTGAAARILIGSGSKTIPVSQITGVQFVPAKFGYRGYIQFTIGGGNERRATLGNRTTDAAHDENSVMFSRKQQCEFVQLRDSIQAAMVTSASNGVSAPDAVDQLRRLVELRDSGVVSAEEFDAAKARLLGGVVCL